MRVRFITLWLRGEARAEHACLWVIEGSWIETELSTLTVQSLCCSVQFGRLPRLRLWKARAPKYYNIPQELSQISFYCLISFAFQIHGNSLNRNSSFPCKGALLISDFILHLSFPIGELTVPLYKYNCSNLWNILMLQTLASIVFVSPGSILELWRPFRCFYCAWVVPDSSSVSWWRNGEQHKAWFGFLPSMQ